MNDDQANAKSLFGRADYLGLITACVTILAIWIIAATVFGVPEYMLPSPAAVATRSAQEFPRLMNDFLTTGTEALLGFAISCILSMMFAVFMILRETAERRLMPMLVVIKSVPIVALAPLIGYWFGYGYSGKIFMAALISFFPLVVNAVAGMRSVNREQSDLFVVMGASQWDEVFKLRMPKAMPHIFSAMRIAAPLAVVGAVVAEMLGAKTGLGSTLAISSMTLDMPLNFAALIGSALLGIASFYTILICERLVLRRLRLVSHSS